MPSLRPDLLLAESAVMGYEDPNFFVRNVQARIIIRNGITYISPAGSNDYLDWLQDFYARLVARDGEGHIFKGFGDMTDGTREPFLKFISSFPGPWRFGAHSAGCVLALRWALWMSQIGMKADFVQLLAAPTLWDAEGAAAYQKHAIPTLRVAMLHDPVPTLPGIHRGGAYESETLVLDRDGVEYAAQDVCSDWNAIGLVAEIAKHHGAGPNYVRGIRCKLNAG